MQIAIDGKRKKWLCDPTEFLTLANSSVPALSASGLYKYLGIRVGAMQGASTVPTALALSLEHLQRAPLKQFQRIFLLRVFLIPRLLHTLVLDVITHSLFKRLDIRVRDHIRKWLRLPHDVHRAFFEADVKDGGLGIMSFRHSVPILQRHRLEKFEQLQSDPVAVAVVQNSESHMKYRRLLQSRNVVYGEVCVTSSDIKRAARGALYQSMDGMGLIHSSLVPAAQKWATSGSGLMSSHNFIRAVQIRAGVCSIKLRKSCGHLKACTLCDACGAVESLGHTLQVCPREHDLRVKRHNAVCNVVAKSLKENGWSITSEPAIKTESGLRRLDLIAIRSESAWVIDVSIVADNATLDVEHQRKISYYNKPNIRNYVTNRSNVSEENVDFTGLIWNWRGAMSPRSWFTAKDMGLTGGSLELAGVQALVCSVMIYDSFQRNTWRRAGIG